MHTLQTLPEDGETLIRRIDLPNYIPVKHQTLARWAYEGKGPKFFRIGKITVYKVADLKDWLSHQAQKNH